MAEIVIVSPDGEKEQTVHEKTFELIYQPHGYTRKPLKELTKEQKADFVKGKLEEARAESSGKKSRVARNEIATAPEKTKLLPDQNTATAVEDKPTAENK